MNPDHLLKHAIKPALKLLEEYHKSMNSDEAAQLLLGTPIQEGQLKYLKQIGGGPALGLWQIEPDTERDNWDNFIDARPKLKKIVNSVLADAPSRTEQLKTNLIYAAMMARIKYWRVPEKLPKYGDIKGQARYWDKYYNANPDHGTVEQYIENWNRYNK